MQTKLQTNHATQRGIGHHKPALSQEHLTYDALRILDFNADALDTIGAEMQFLRELAHGTIYSS